MKGAFKPGLLLVLGLLALCALNAGVFAQPTPMNPPRDKTTPAPAKPKDEGTDANSNSGSSQTSNRAEIQPREETQPRENIQPRQ